MHINSGVLKDITPYIYGTTRLGDDSISIDKRLEIADYAMNSGVWFHTSHQYNTALNILGKAFNNNQTKIPKLIVKLGGNNMKEFREDIKANMDPLGIDNIEVGQLCLGGQLAQEFAAGGDCYEEFQKIKEEGLVNAFVMEVFPWTSGTALNALKSGYSKLIADAHIFYLNPLQRFASNPLWNLLQEQKTPIIAMRTVSGGPVHSLRDIPGFAWKDYLQKRASEIAPIFEQSGLDSWTEFCVRFAHSLPSVISTVGATSRLENFKDFLNAAESIPSLPEEIIRKISELHKGWSDELDIHAEPWSM